VAVMPSRRALRGSRFFSVLLALSAGFSALAQVPGPYASDSGGAPVPAQIPDGAPAQLLAPDQLDNLVSPVALYPDQLLSQVLAASTYPLEIVEAQQWLQQNGYLRGSQLVDAVKQQNWDPSVQALVIFPNTLAMLNRDVQWTTTLGNAFLAQQADVMDAIQRLRARAQNNGSLRSTPQQIVTTQPQGGANPIEIQPADPRMMYVPSYNPQNVWGPPAQGYYPQVENPSAGYSGSSTGSSIGQFLGTAVNLASYFTGFGGLAGGGWGWALNWLTHSVLLNGSFLDMFGFHGGNSYGGSYLSGGGYGAPSVWVHDPRHRGGVPYSNREVAGRFGGGYRTRNVTFNSRSNFGGVRFDGGARIDGGSRSFGGDRIDGGARYDGSGHYDGGSHGNFGGVHYDGGSRANFGGGWRTPAGDRISGQSSWRTPSSTRFSGNSYTASDFGSAGRSFSSGGYGANRAPGYPSAALGPGNGVNSFRNSPSPAWSPRNAPAVRASNQHFSEARSRERFSAPRESSRHFSAPHFSAPHVSRSHGSGGHSSGGHGSKNHGSGGHSHKH